MGVGEVRQEQGAAPIVEGRRGVRGRTPARPRQLKLESVFRRGGGNPSFDDFSEPVPRPKLLCRDVT